MSSASRNSRNNQLIETAVKLGAKLQVMGPESFREGRRRCAGRSKSENVCCILTQLEISNGNPG